MESATTHFDGARTCKSRGASLKVAVPGGTGLERTSNAIVRQCQTRKGQIRVRLSRCLPGLTSTRPYGGMDWITCLCDSTCPTGSTSSPGAVPGNGVQLRYPNPGGTTGEPGPGKGRGALVVGKSVKMKRTPAVWMFIGAGVEQSCGALSRFCRQ